MKTRFARSHAWMSSSSKGGPFPSWYS